MKIILFVVLGVIFGSLCFLAGLFFASAVECSSKEEQVFKDAAKDIHNKSK